MNCQELESLTADYLGGELDEAQRDRCAAHLSTCPACQGRIAEFEETLAELNRLVAVPLSGMTVMSGEDNPASPKGVAGSSRFRRLMVSTMKAAAVLVLGVLIGRASVGSGQPRPSHGDGEEAVVQYAQNGPAPHVHPKWIEMGRDLQRGPSSLASQLLILAESGRP